MRGNNEMGKQGKPNIIIKDVSDNDELLPLSTHETSRTLNIPVRNSNMNDKTHLLPQAHSLNVNIESHSLDYGSFSRIRRRLSSSSRQASELLFSSLRKRPSMTLINSMRESAGLIHREPFDNNYPTDLISEIGSVDRDYASDEPTSNDKRQSSVWVAAYNVTNLIQGIGIMGIPYACATVGWLSIPAIIIVALVSGFTALLIGECLYKPMYERKNFSPVSERTFHARSTYACIAADVWPKHGRKVVSALVLTELFGALILYLILLGNSIEPLINRVATTQHSLAFYTATLGFTIYPFLIITKIKFVAWFSVLAVIGLFTSIGVILVYCIIHLSLDQLNFTNLPAPDASKLPVSLGVIIFSYCAHPVLPGIESSMKCPDKYPIVIKATFAFAALLKLIFGLCPLFVFGSNIQQVVADNITDSIIVISITKITIAINAFFSMPIIVYIIGEQLDSFMEISINRHFNPNSRGKIYFTWLTLNRFILLGSALAIAIYVPHFVLIMSLIGSLTGSCLTFILPAYFHIKLFRYRLSMLGLITRNCIIIFGVFTMVFGFIFSSKDLYEVLKKPGY